MINILLSVMAILLPWIMGYAVTCSFLKKRYGYRALGLGVGFVVGWTLLTLLMQLYVFLGRDINVIELIIIQGVVALALLIFFPAKRCSIDEQRLEKAASNLAYLSSFLLGALVIYHSCLMLLPLINQAPFAWSPWIEKLLSLPANAQLEGPFDITLLTDKLLTADGLALQQVYVAMAWGNWGQPLINILGIMVVGAIVCVTFGGLRYLGASLFPAILTAYAVISLPLLNAEIMQGNYADIWITSLLLNATLLWAICLSYFEWRILALLLVLVIAAFISSKVALIFFVGLLTVLVWRLLGPYVGIVSLVFIGFVLHARDWLSLAQFSHLTPPSKNPFIEASYAYLGTLIKAQWFVLDLWHFTLLGCAGSLVFLIFAKKNSLMKNFVWLIATSLVALLTAIALILSAGTLDENASITLINRVGLYFIPVILLLPASVYQFTNNDDETIPTF